MLHWLRRSRRLLEPLAVVLGTMVVVGTTDWWHANDDDFAVAVSHDHTSHHAVFNTERSSDRRAPEHCFLCHWLRSFQNGLRLVSPYAIADTETACVQPVRLLASGYLFSTLLPARAPPA